MKFLKTTLTVALFAVAGAAMAQPAQPGAMMHAPGERIVKILKLDTVRADQVRTIVADSRAQAKALWAAKKENADPAARQAFRAQMKTLHEQTQAKLSAVLTPAEMATLKEARHHRHHGMGMKQG
jgi:hypothetical protein